MAPSSRLKGALFLLPNLIGEQKDHAPFLPHSVDEVVGELDGLIAESERAGRRYLGRFATKRPARDIPIALYSKRIDDAEITFLLEPILKGERWGLLSDAGLPCVADPGHRLVFRARQQGLPIRAFVGPSSLMLALMLSGLPAQQFAFHGYLPKEPKERAAALRRLEERAKKERVTQLFIEAPYRNRSLLETALFVLADQTLFCAAWELTTSNEGIVSQPVALWKKMPLPNLEKKRTVFLLSASSL